VGSEGANGVSIDNVWQYTSGSVGQHVVYRTASSVEPGSGPFGESTVAEALLLQFDPSKGDDTQFWGGRPFSLNSTRGQELWLSFWVYFRSDFCFSYSTSGESGEFIKWIRIRAGSNTNDRSNLEIGQFRSGGCGSTAYLKGDISELDGDYHPFPNGGQFGFGRGKWHHFSLHYKFHESNGWIRAWLDDNYLGQTDDHPTMASSSASVTAVTFGDYWNGGLAQRSALWTSNWIASKEAPNFSDKGGRPYLPSTLRAADLR
jgi:hypothetical protein